MTEHLSRLGRLVEALYSATLDRKINWSEGGEDSKFQARLGSYIFVIYQRYDHEVDDVYTLLDMKSLEGKTIETITSGMLGGSVSPTHNLPWWQIMDELFAGARRGALGVDDAIDEVLSVLGS